MSENAKTAPKTPKSDQIEIGALWKKEGQTQKFLAGNLDFKNLDEAQWNEFVKTKKLATVIFTNKFKQQDTHPDLRVYLSKPKPITAPTAAPVKSNAPAAAPVATDNEII